MDVKKVLTVAGSDSSGGAGIQADLKTIAAHLMYGESVVCALTAQNTVGVQGVFDVPPQFITAQMDSVFSDVFPDAVKVGMVSTAGAARAVARALRAHGARNVVVDPVMVATSGGALLRGDAFDALVGELLPVADVVTPNLPEAAALAGLDAEPRDVDAMVAAARALARLTPGAVLVKGGHLDGGAEAVDVLLAPGASEPVILRGPRVATRNTHGTGCTLSSAIACGLAEGLSVEEAVRRAKAYLARCLAAGLDVGSGSGPVDHMAAWRGRIPEDVPACGTGCPGSAAPGPASSPASAVPARPAGTLAAELARARLADLPARPRVLIVGGSPERPSPQLLATLALQADVVVACDAGADACRAAGVAVDVLVGDDDSVSADGLAFARGTASSELTYPVDKDDVDLGLALAWVRGRCPDALDVTLTGVSGGRADHALAAVGLAARAADLRPCIEEDGASLCVLSPAGQPTWEFAPGDVGRTASVVALLGPACVSECGMRWDLDHATLDELDDLGVSNVVVSEGARVTVHAGVALVALLRERIEKRVTRG